MNRRDGIRKSARILIAAAVLAGLCAGCRHRGHLITEEMDATGRRKPAPDKILPIENAGNVREDIIYPPGGTRQSFYWQDRYSEWRFRFPSRGYAYAGFRLRYPLNLSQGLDEYVLSFRIRPLNRAEGLWLALVDGHETGPAVLIEVPLKDYLNPKRSKLGYEVKIPLREMPLKGVAVRDEEGRFEEGETVFDWVDVRQIRIVNHAGQMRSGDIVITDLAIRR